MSFRRIEGKLTKRGIVLVILNMGGEKLATRKPTSKLMLTILAGGGDVGTRDHAGTPA